MHPQWNLQANQIETSAMRVSSVRDHPGNQSRCIHRIIVLPHNDWFPSCLAELRLRVSVSRGVDIHLLRPIINICLWNSKVVRTGVPKASVDEDSDARGPKHNVGPTIELHQRSRINSIAHAHAMKFST
jgi:hypothetical protein